ncbi:MAG TPA: hypothetical protein VH419_16975, partial [Nocardioidaceae bacterium]
MAIVTNMTSLNAGDLVGRMPGIRSWLVTEPELPGRPGPAVLEPHPETTAVAVTSTAAVRSDR